MNVWGIFITDIYSEQKRHEIMSKIRGKDSKPELIIRKFLFSKGFRFRINDVRYLGKPDIVLPKYRTIIFVNGCFWHNHENCRRAQLPKTNTEFWLEKIKENVERDSKNISLLKREGWNVIVIWECEILTKQKRKNRLDLLVHEITSNLDVHDLT
ncbi:very short patch repair endonuclease [Methanococcoides sp. NM1]|uniref:very short patch repair endonuclease n=1 Tax=Methanococcoides sp. NM1 TaxID=1201013 RepID=UPI001AEFB084|nr:DNA mismatch endonuclease Vsr [Methanococcoides sp. NM1]